MNRRLSLTVGCAEGFVGFDGSVSARGSNFSSVGQAEGGTTEQTFTASSCGAAFYGHESAFGIPVQRAERA
jgi:hypothetical protein